MRTNLRVVAAEGLRVRMADETGQIVRHQMITAGGLYDERTRSTAPGPVEVAATPYITRLVAAGNLIEVKPEAPAPASVAHAALPEPPKPIETPRRKTRAEE